MFRFAGFELDQRRAELRGPDGDPIRLRPKTFELLLLLAANAGRVVAKGELIDAVWPDVHVGDEGLFQCVRELRVALGDERREMVKLVSKRGYIFTPAVTAEPDNAITARASDTPAAPAAGALEDPPPQTAPAAVLRRRHLGVAAVVAGLCVIAGLAVAIFALGSGAVFGRQPPTIAVIPIVDASNAPIGAAMADAVTARLVDGLARIDGIRVVAEPTSPLAGRTDFTVRGELRHARGAWTLQMRMIRSATGEVESVANAAIAADGPNIELQQSRLAAGVGHLLARRLNRLIEGGGGPVPRGGSARGSAAVAIEQAGVSINQTSRERFGVAEAMLEDALAAEPDNIDVAVALSALQLRGIQMVWYSPEESAAARAQAEATLGRAMRTKPNAIAVAETNCRFLSATNRFVESLVECSRALALDPWNGLALYHVGIAQIHLGRFEDALATFEQADRFDTPQVSRWTWLLGAGWADILLGRGEDALPWLHRSIAITPGSGRSHMLLAAAYQQTGQVDEARAAMHDGLRLRPGTTALNVASSFENASPAYVEASRRVIAAMVEAGLPER